MMPSGEELAHSSVLVWRTVKLAAEPPPPPKKTKNKQLFPLKSSKGSKIKLWLSEKRVWF